MGGCDLAGHSPKCRFGMQVQNLFAQVMEYTLRHATRYFWISSVHDLWFRAGEGVWRNHRNNIELKFV